MSEAAKVAEGVEVTWMMMQTQAISPRMKKRSLGGQIENFSTGSEVELGCRMQQPENDV